MAPVKIYTRQWCGYCTRALRLLDAKGVAYEHVDTTNDPQTRAWLVTATRQSTVPQIFIAGRSIGGCDELYDLERRGELDRLLQSSSSSAGSG